MVLKVSFSFVLIVLLSSTFSSAHPGLNWGGGGGGGGGSGGYGGDYFGLLPEFYQYSCPQANDIVMSALEKAILREPRMAASLLRLHFHDCFVQGCDASVLLDDSATIASEKRSNPNRNSIRGFEVIDEIKAKLEEECPQTVSCADILALTARGSTILSGGPDWEVPLGRRDSRTASISLSNRDIPPPNSTLQNLVNFFNRQGLDEVNLVALSGSHTIGVARCVSFRQRLYNQNEDNRPDETLERSYYYGLTSVCPRSGGNGGRTTELVKSYAEDEGLFFNHFAKSMVKMGNISPLTGSNGEVRKNCRRIN